MSRIVVCGSQTLYVRGGAEILVQTLAERLRARGHEVDEVNLPFTDQPRSQDLFGFLAWRMLNLKAVRGSKTDLLIATKFPTYAATHPNKVVWLVHQHRQAYELYGTRYSDMHTRPDGWLAARMVRGLDGWSLGEARRRFAISANVAGRLRRYNGLDATPLHPPPKLGEYLHCGEYGDFLLAVGRFEPIKRFDLILGALAHAPEVHLVLAGDGMERSALAVLATDMKVLDRVKFLGEVDDKTLVDLYARCLGVVYPPFDEDYGYVTVEAFLARKPVITTTDAGGPLEFVRDGANGYVAAPESEALGNAMSSLWSGRKRAPEMGAAGYEAVAAISWDRVLDGLTATLR